MIPSSFTYKRAGSAEEACDLAAEYGEDAKYLAGGHSLLPLMKLRLAAPEVIIDLGGLRDLSYITDQGSHIAINCDLVVGIDLNRQHLRFFQVPEPLPAVDAVPLLADRLAVVELDLSRHREDEVTQPLQQDIGLI